MFSLYMCLLGRPPAPNHIHMYVYIPYLFISSFFRRMSWECYATNSNMQMRKYTNEHQTHVRFRRCWFSCSIFRLWRDVSLSDYLPKSSLSVLLVIRNPCQLIICLLVAKLQICFFFTFRFAISVPINSRILLRSDSFTAFAFIRFAQHLSLRFTSLRSALCGYTYVDSYHVLSVVLLLRFGLS